MRFLTRIFLVIGLLVCLSILGGCTSEPSAEEDLAAARKAYVARQYLEAERLYERYLRFWQKGTQRWEVWNKLVELAVTVRQDNKSATELLETMYLEYSIQPEKARSILKRLAELHHQSRQWDKVIGVWQRFLNLPDLPVEEVARANRMLGKVYLTQTSYDLAIDVFQSCIDMQLPSDIRTDCLLDLAQAYAFLENLDPAVRYLEELLLNQELEESKRAIAVLLLADIVEQQGNTNKAIDLLESIRTTYPNPKVVEARLKYLKDN